MKKQKHSTYLSEFFLTSLGYNFDLSNVLNVLELTNNEIANRNTLSDIPYQELKDLWDVLKDFSSILTDNKNKYTTLYDKISIFLIQTKGAA